MRPHVIAWLDGFLPHGVASAIAPSWFTCVGLAGLVTLFAMLFVARRHGIDRGVVASMVLWCYVSAVIAGIVVPSVIDGIENLFATGHLRFRWAGMTSFWGYLAGGIAVATVCKRNALPLARLGDLIAAPFGLALAVSRLGCFLGGCDYGKVTSVPWGMRFPSGSPAWRDHVRSGLVPAERGESLPVHPTQLYESLLGIVVAVVALVLLRTLWARRREGRVFVAAIAIYAIGRLGIETLRGDLGRGIYGGLSSGQLFSLAVLAVIAAGFVISRHRLARVAAAASVVGVLALASTEAHAQQPAPVVAQPPPANPAATASTDPLDPPKLQVGALVGFATPLNRRPDQVSALGGPSISIGYALDKLMLWVDVDSYGNADATHGTLLASAGMMSMAGDKLRIGGRAGIGVTLVNFDEPAFRDIAGTTLRFEGIAEYTLGARWLLSIRPLTLDILTAGDLGGPITTYQMRIGAAYRFGGNVPKKPEPPRPPPPQYQYPQYPQPQPYPYPYPPPQPYPQPYPQPQPYPPPQQPYPPPQQPYPPPQQPYPPPQQPQPQPPRPS